jgi:phosphatidate cytidylyltransferase
MVVATLSWLAIFILFVFVPYAGWVPFCSLILLIAYGAIREFFILNDVYSKVGMAVSAALLALMGAAVGTGQTYIFYCVPGMLPFVFFPLHMLRQSWEGVIRTVSIQVVGIIYWGWLILHFMLLHRLDGGYGAIIVLCTMIALNDNTAYYTGKLLGKKGRKMSPRISPNKTWVGFAGGFTATVVSALAFAYALPALTVVERLLLGLVTGCAIPVGDLIESAMKRDLGVKDSGTLIPGHGGVMDRFDSWTFTTPIVYYFLLLLKAGQA